MTPEAPLAPPAAGAAPRLALAAIVRNEAPYLLEWIAHHRALGIRDLLVADNASDDGSSELLAALDALGVVRRVPFPSPPGRAPQLPAYAHLLGEVAPATGAEWVAIIDADEFLVPEPPAPDAPGARDPSAWLARVLAPLAAEADVGAVAMNWAIHGSSWLANHSAGLVTERFVRRARADFGANLHYKTLLRLAAFESVSGNPHHMELRAGWRLVHPDGREVAPHPRHGKGLSAEVVWAGLRVNHYIVKSREEFDTRKARNGSAATLGRVKGDDYFRAHDRNDTRDAVPEPLLAATRAGMADLAGRLRAAGAAVPEPVQAAPRHARPFEGVQGHVDRLAWSADGRLQVRGWAMGGTGRPPRYFAVRGPQVEQIISEHERYARPDIQRHFPMADPRCGFQFLLELPGGPEGGVAGLEVRAGDSPETLGPPMPIPPQVLAALSPSAPAETTAS